MSKLTLKGMTSLVPMPSNDMLIRQAQLELCDWKAKLRRNSKDLEALCYAGEVADTLGRVMYSKDVLMEQSLLVHQLMDPFAHLTRQEGITMTTIMSPDDVRIIPFIRDDFLNMAASYYMRGYQAAPKGCQDPIYGRILYNMASLVQDGLWDMLEEPSIPRSPVIAQDILKKMEIVTVPGEGEQPQLSFGEILTAFYSRSGYCGFFPSMVKMAEISLLDPDAQNLSVAQHWLRFGEETLRNPKPKACVEDPFKSSFLSLMQSILDPQNDNLMLKVQTDARCSRPLTFSFMSVAEDHIALRV